MEIQHENITYTKYDSIDEMPADLRALLTHAETAAKLAYAPYSEFFVGAAVRLANGKVVTGSNRENSSFPAGICAERTALAAAGHQYPGVAVEAMAITVYSEKYEAFEALPPCGVCRQVMNETEMLQDNPMEVVFSGMKGTAIRVLGMHNLLPFSFNLKAR